MSFISIHHLITLVPIFLSVAPPRVDGLSALLTHLLKHNQYDPQTLPTTTEHPRIDVLIGLMFRRVLNFDERRQIFSSSIWIKEAWVDPLLTWDPLKFGGVDKVFIPGKQLWRPDLRIYDTALRAFSDDVVADVSYKGEVHYTYPATIHVSCTLNTYHFPFDEQSCPLIIGSWAYEQAVLDVLPFPKNSIDMKYYLKHGEWELIFVKSVKGETRRHGVDNTVFSNVTFWLQLKRRSDTLFYYIYFPNVLMNLLSLFSFLLPCDSTEKINLGISILLTMTVYILMLPDILPMSGIVPIIVHYMSYTYVLVGVSLTMSIIVLKIHHNGHHDNNMEVPPWVRDIFLHKFARLVGMQRYVTTDEDHQRTLQAAVSKVSIVSDDEDESQARPDAFDQHSDMLGSRRFSTDVGVLNLHDMLFSKNVRVTRDVLRQHKEVILAKILRHSEEFLEREVRKSKEWEIRREWQQLAMVIERLCFFVYIAMLLAVSTFTFHQHTIAITTEEVQGDGEVWKVV
ncbi:Neuronal acetylcholine receptor subunit beta-3 [Lamellibrachia satsuma]|nr:Neuronal acetylcholine receptor subunit beta-3 [Lamellibrachia satsuma]